MKLHTRDEHLTVWQGHALEVLRSLPDESFQCVVTSPPYWGLRDYKTPPVKFSDGWEGHLGLEKTPWLYLTHMVEIFEEVRRVIRKDGTCWVNMGDCYATGAGKVGNCPGGGERGERWARGDRNGHAGKHGYVADGIGPMTQPNKLPIPGLKPKDMIGLPWRLAFALQDAGWYLRSDIIWAKRNCMPESVTDRPTKAHEYVFLLSRSERYYYDAEAIRERSSPDSHARGRGVNPKAKTPGKNSRIHVDRDPVHTSRGAKQSRQNESFSAAVAGLVTARNKRSVWSVATKAFKGAHFATYPPSLIRPCILAGTSASGCCSKCGKPRERIIEIGDPDRNHQMLCGGDLNGEYKGEATKNYAGAKAQNASAVKARILAGMRERKTVGWKFTCKCPDPEAVPCEVLDPFGGSGTTAQVAIEEGRKATLIELNPDYLPLIDQRTSLLRPQNSKALATNGQEAEV